MHAMVVFGHTFTRLVMGGKPIYICGPAWTSIMSTNDEKGYQGGFFFFASSYRIVGRPIPSLIKFERMLSVVNPRSVWGFYGSKAWCHIKFPHWVSNTTHTTSIYILGPHAQSGFVFIQYSLVRLSATS